MGLRRAGATSHTHPRFPDMAHRPKYLGFSLFTNACTAIP